MGRKDPPHDVFLLKFLFDLRMNFRIQKGWECMGCTPPPFHLLSENSTNKGYLATSNFYIFNSPLSSLKQMLRPPHAFYNNKKNIDLNNPFYRPYFLKLLRPDFSNLPYLYSTFHLEYPSILSRFYFTIKITMLCISKNNSVHTANLLIGYTMTSEIPVNVNTTLIQERLPVIPGFTSLYAYKKRSAFSHFRKFLQTSSP